MLMYHKVCVRVTAFMVDSIRMLLRIGHALRWVLFPTFCVSCKCLLQINYSLCDGCKKEIRPLVSVAVPITKKYAITVHAVGAYRDPLRKLILAKSYHDMLACYYIAQLIFETFGNRIQADYLVPIPLHWSRYAKRGYNQSWEIAMHLSRLTGIPLLHVLQRHEHTRFQAACTYEQRYTNVKDAFTLILPDHQPIEKYRYKKLLLIDDVMTTGATLRAASKVLLLLRPLGLSALVLARTDHS